MQIADASPNGTGTICVCRVWRVITGAVHIAEGAIVDGPESASARSSE